MILKKALSGKLMKEGISNNGKTNEKSVRLNGEDRTERDILCMFE